MFICISAMAFVIQKLYLKSSTGFKVVSFLNPKRYFLKKTLISSFCVARSKEDTRKSIKAGKWIC